MRNLLLRTSARSSFIETSHQGGPTQTGDSNRPSWFFGTMYLYTLNRHVKSIDAWRILGCFGELRMEVNVRTSVTVLSQSVKVYTPKIPGQNLALASMCVASCKRRQRYIHHRRWSNATHGNKSRRRSRAWNRSSKDMYNGVTSAFI
jgi:hypothetical protein